MQIKTRLVYCEKTIICAKLSMCCMCHVAHVLSYKYRSTALGDGRFAHQNLAGE